ncbi:MULTISPECIES: polysaccharide biosynthesis protein [unclassified Ensifer]|uniref:polysaccharide biosynthesis protein n=1 Tax=unclassified Ensifer TaxID=2633371 RepID=UPI000812DA79|nr:MULTISPECIES: polysaccharide biosynthesis protein [unclassified Ensifer]OCP18650.1 UDP-glucose 4-epimerase [Ensifer sp. LC54]OCP18683.1 UDP-glucose 4-epimerase [Ensifer sp. LC384]
MFTKKTILITGGTGSFGNAVVQKFMGSDIGEIRIFSRDEKKQEDMRHRIRDERVKYFIGDVRDYNSIDSALKGVDYVFHAAALKQVPSCEFYPMEAVKTNVLGAQNVINASIYNRVKRVIVLSTDKAVYPINAMGLTKALMEKIAIATSRTLSRSDTVLCATRYGNVMASRGSVIPLFIGQILRGAELTITDPNMTRFLMPLSDSVKLVEFAYNNGGQGDIFVQKAPACTVGDLAEAIQRIFNTKAKVNIIGTRHGEKLFESLISREEMARAQDLGDYYRVPCDDRDLNYAKFFTEGEQKVSISEDYTSHNTHRLDVEGVIELLMSLEYVQHALKSPGVSLSALEN